MPSLTDALIPALLANWQFFTLVGVIVILSTFFKSPMGKGMVGEWLIRGVLKFGLDKTGWTRIDNVTIPDGRDGTTQIDHILLGRSGIYVIETKNYTGWIFGSENQAQWTQKIYRHSSKFQNPLRQNYKHVKALAKMLDVPEDLFLSVIVFLGGATLKTRDKLPKNVCYPLEMLGYVKAPRPQVLTPAEITALAEAIRTGKKPAGLKTHRDHVAYVRTLHTEKKTPPAPPSLADRLAFAPADGASKPQTCPKCGKDLVLRTVKKGPNAGNTFMGCAGFPSCRYRASITP